MNKIEVLSDALCIVGESPLWDVDRRMLHYVDIHGKRVRHLDYDRGKVVDEVMPMQTGALLLEKDGSLLGCMEDGIYRFPGNGEIIPLFAPLQLHGPRFNDVKIGPDGAIYGGTINYDGNGALYRIDQTDNLKILLENVGNSNGLDWDIEHGWFYYNDTPTMQTDRFRFNVVDGTVSERETVRGFLPEEGNPDGMTLDAENMLWVALWGHGKVLRIDPATGKTLQELKLPVSNVSCCTFAGDGLHDLIITSAAHNINLRKEPLAGALFRVRVDVPGKPVYRFG